MNKRIDGTTIVKSSAFRLLMQIVMLTLVSAAALGSSVELQTAPLVTPTNAWTYYGAATTHTTGVAAPTSTPAEIAELARALGSGRYSNQAYALTVYEYVRNNIETDFRFGLSKGARGAIIDQTGTAFDQANLMVALLRAGGITATYQVGTISLSTAQFQAWTGLANPATGLVNTITACQFLADGAVPATVNGSSTCTGLTGTLPTTGTPIVMAHVWVSANGQIYDPAYKIHVIKTGVDIAAQMSCGTASAPTCGTTVLANVPGTQTLVAGVSYVPGAALTQANIEAQLKTYATNLQHYIQTTNVSKRSTSNPNMQVEDLIGGALIDTSQALPAQAANPISQLPLAAYQTTPQYSWSGDIPDKFRTTLTVSFDNINQLLYADEVAGNRLRIWGTTVSGTSLIRNVTLYSEYLPLVTSSLANTTDSPVPLTLTVQHPYAANSGTYASEAIQFTPKMQTSGAIGVISIVAGWGEASDNTVSHFATLQKRDLTAEYPTNPTDPKHIWQRRVYTTTMPFDCIATTTSDPLQLPGLDTGCFEAHQATIAANWLAQSSRGAKLAGQINGVVLQNHHSLGLILSGLSIQPSTFLDLRSTVSANSRIASASDRSAALAGAAAVKGRLEGSVLEQSLDSTVGGDGISMIAMTNALSTKLLQITASNFTAASAQLTNYVSSTISNLQSLVTAGYTLIVPQNGTTAGAALFNGTLTYRFAGVAAYQPNQIGYLAEGVFLNGAIGLDGGGGGAPSRDPAASVIAATKTLEYASKGRQRYGVNLANGDLTLTPAPDLTTGLGDFPYSLSFQRIYSPQNLLTDSALATHGIVDAGGWTNTLAIYAKIGSDPMAGLGRDSALNAAGSIAAIYVLRTLNTGSTDIRSNLATMFATHWLGENLYDNVVSVARPPKTTLFVKLPDTTFNPDPGSADLLTQSGTRNAYSYVWGNIVYDSSGVVFSLTDKDGSVLRLVEENSYPGTYDNFPMAPENFFMPTTWTFKNGVTLTFSYPTGTSTCKPCLSSVSNNLGRSLTFTNGGGSSPTVQDQSGRQVVENFTPTVWGVTSTMTVTTPDSGVTTYNYVTNPGVAVNRSWNQLANWITPLGGTPYVTVGYDSLYRVKSLTDNASPQNTTNYFVGALYGRENQKRGEEMQPQGLLASAPLLTKYFDLNSLQLQSIDALGRITSSVYDTNRNLISTTYPEMNADVFTYDVRSNRLSVTHRPKTGSSLATPPPELTTYVEGPTVTSCAFPASCNLFASTTDANGNVTTYTYLGQNTAAGTGQLQRTVGPAVTAQAGGISGSAQTDYCYSNVTGNLSLPSATIKKVDSTTNRVKSFTYNTLANYFALLTATADPSTTYVPPASAGGVCTTSAKTGALVLTTTFAFDTAGNPHTIDGPIPGSGDLTTYTFDSMRRLTTVAAPLSVFTRHCYDLDGELLSTNRWSSSSAPSDPNSTTEATTGQCPTAFSASSWQSDTKTYFPTGDLKTSADAEGNTTTYSYDPIGRQQVVQDPDGRQIAKVFDLAGEVIAEWRGGSGWINGSGNPSGTWPTSWTPASYAGSGPVRYESYCNGAACYSANGKPQYAVDANNNVTQYQYDGLDRLRWTLFPDPTAGTLCTIPANGAVNFDSGPPTCTGLQTYEQSAYDNQGNRTSFRTRKGDAIGFHFDAMNRQDTKSPASQGAVTTGFNLLGEPLNVSKALFGSNPAHTTTYTYDANGRELTEKNDTLTVAHQYDTLVSANDNAGNRTRTTWPNGYFVTYQYDVLNRMVDVRENSTSTNELAFYKYDTLSRRAFVCMGAYTATSCQTGTWNNKAAYGYEADSQLNSLSQTLNGTTVSLGYVRNNSYQIRNFTASDSFYLPTPVTASSTAYVSNALNEYGSISGQSSTYDTNGNLLTWFPTGGKHTYTYDSENRLTTAAVNGGATSTISYDYDALGRRNSKTVSGVTTTYLLDGDEEIAEYSGATVLRHYVTGAGIDDRIAHAEGSSISNPTKTYYHVNHQGSVMAMTDGSGNVTQRIGYDEYGNGSPPTGEQFGYTGRRFDPETGLYYYRARYYAPAIGRFLQVDPVGYKDNLNLYTYVGGDPLNNTDPTGKATDAMGNWFPAEDDDISGGVEYNRYLVPAAIMLTPIVAVAACVAGGCEGAAGTAVAAGVAKGAYKITTASKKWYVGKGPVKRMRRSQLEKEKQTGEKSTTEHRASDPNTDEQAFKDEAQWIRDSGGIKDPKSLNKINSPGEKMLPPSPSPPPPPPPPQPPPSPLEP